MITNYDISITIKPFSDDKCQVKKKVPENTNAKGFLECQGYNSETLLNPGAAIFYGTAPNIYILKTSLRVTL